MSNIRKSNASILVLASCLALTLEGVGAKKVELDLNAKEVDVGTLGDVEVPMTLLEHPLKKAAASGERSYTSVYSCWCDWYQTRWAKNTDSLEPTPQAELDEISDKYIEKCAKKLEENPKSANAHEDYGEALYFRERWAVARKEFEAALKLEPEASYAGIRRLYRVAETYYGEGNLEKCKEVLKHALDLNVNTFVRGGANWSVRAYDAYMYLTDEDLNYYKMPRDTGFKPFPEPQQFESTETFAACPKIAINLKGVSDKDARIVLLAKKLSWRGFKWSIGGEGYPLSIALDASAPVDKREGYTLEATEKGASIQARDLRGILWGIVSFLQITDEKNHTIRVCKVNDWPDCPRRGYLGTFWSGCTEFTVFNKMTTVVHQGHPILNGELSPLNVYQCERMGNEFRDLGIEVQYGILSWTMDMAWPYAWKSFLGMQIEIGKKIASMGAGVYYPNDDCRYMPDVLKPIDLEGGKKPSDYDAQHILDFYTAIKKDYPDFIMTYCPPWYWGPYGSYPYDDDRDKYLRSMRILPPEVSIIWTGERVKSYHKRKSSVDWVSGLTHHKPLLFQNATGPHSRLSYVVDRTDWNGWHYPGFFENDIEGYLKNATTPTECPQITSLADCLWNVKGYEPDRGIRRGLSNYIGEQAFKAFDRAYNDLCYIDKYEYGRISTEVRDENLEEIERKLKNIEDATEELHRLTSTNFMRTCAAWMRAVEWFRGMRNAVKNPPDFKKMYSGPLGRVRDMALAAGYDAKNGDILLDAIDLHHAPVAIIPPATKAQPLPKNQMSLCFIGDGCHADAEFRVDNLTSTNGMATIYIYGQGGGGGDFHLKINDETVYSDKTPFASKKNCEFKVPLSVFKPKAKNRIFIENWLNNPPLLVGYVVIKFGKSEDRDAESFMKGEGDDEISLDE